MVSLMRFTINATQIRCVVQLKSQHSLRLIDYNKYIRDKGELNDKHQDSY